MKLRPSVWQYWIVEWKHHKAERVSKDVSGEYFEKGMGLEIDQNIVDTFFLISNRVQEDKISIFCKL